MSGNTNTRSRSKLIPRFAGEAEYLEAKRIAGELYKVHQVCGGLTRADAVMLATLCATLGGKLECDPIPIEENDLFKQNAALQEVAASIRKKPSGLVRRPEANSNRSKSVA